MRKFPLQNPLNVHTLVGCNGTPNDPACLRCPVNTRIEFLYPDIHNPEVRVRMLTRLQDKKPGSFRLDALGDLFAPHVTDKEAYAIIRLCHSMLRHKFMFATRYPERIVSNPAIMRKLTSCDNIHVGIRISTAQDAHRVSTLYSKFLPVTFLSFDPVMEDLRSIIVGRPHYAIIAAHDGAKGDPYPQIGLLDLIRSLEKKGVKPYVRNIGNQYLDSSKTAIDPGGFNSAFWIRELQQYAL